MASLSTNLAPMSAGSSLANQQTLRNSLNTNAGGSVQTALINPLALAAKLAADKEAAASNYTMTYVGLAAVTVVMVWYLLKD